MMVQSPVHVEKWERKPVATEESDPRTISEMKKWSQLAKKWIYYLPPARPSTQDVASFRRIIRENLGQIPKPKALVLGSTPEFRDLLFEERATISVVDKNPHMIKEMNRLRVYKNPETLYVDDWFHFLPAHSHSFDLILSDLTQGNIPYPKQEEFYRIISQALVPGGVFADRFLIYRDLNKLYRADIEFKGFAKSAINLFTLNEMLFKCFLGSDLTHKWQVCHFEQFYKYMQKNYSSPVLEKYITLMKKFLGSGAIVWHYGKDWAEISNVYFKYLKLVSEIPDTESVLRGIAIIMVSKPI